MRLNKRARLAGVQRPELRYLRDVAASTPDSAMVFCYLRMAADSRRDEWFYSYIRYYHDIYIRGAKNARRYLRRLP